MDSVTNRSTFTTNHLFCREFNDHSIVNYDEQSKYKRKDNENNKGTIYSDELVEVCMNEGNKKH